LIIQIAENCQKIARKLDILITGSLGVLITAKNKGVIDPVKPIVEKIKKINFRMSEYLVEKVLHLATETKKSLSPA